MTRERTLFNLGASTVMRASEAKEKKKEKGREKEENEKIDGKQGEAALPIEEDDDPNAAAAMSAGGRARVVRVEDETGRRWRERPLGAMHR